MLCGSGIIINTLYLKNTICIIFYSASASISRKLCTCISEFSDCCDKSFNSWN